MRLKTRKFGQHGDTIVEVMVSITVMALALGAAYALSNRSFHTAQNTEERTEALAIAEGQIEFLRNAGLSGTIGNLIATYSGGGGFCFNDSDGATADESDDYCVSYGPDDASPYDIRISYCDGSGGCGQAGVFTVRASWIGFGGGQQVLTLYFKPAS